MVSVNGFGFESKCYLSTSCRVFLAVNFAYSKGENELEGGKTVFPPPTLVFPSASCFSSSKTLHSVDKAYILLHILQNMCKILVRMNNLSDFPGIFHFNSMFFHFSDSNWKCGHTRGENYVFPTRVAMFPVFIRKMEKHRISIEKAGKSTSIVILPRSYTYSEEYTRE